MLPSRTGVMRAEFPQRQLHGLSLAACAYLSAAATNHPALHSKGSNPMQVDSVCPRGSLRMAAPIMTKLNQVYFGHGHGHVSAEWHPSSAYATGPEHLKYILFVGASQADVPSLFSFTGTYSSFPDIQWKTF